MEEGGAGLGEVTFLPLCRGSVLSSLKIVHIVVWICGVVIGFMFPFSGSSWFRPEGPQAPSSHRSSHVVACRWRIVCYPVRQPVRGGPVSDSNDPNLINMGCRGVGDPVGGRWPRGSLWGFGECSLPSS